MKITYFSEAVGCETKTSFSSNKLIMTSCCVSLNFSIWKRSNTHFTEQNSSAAMLDRQVTELTNHREACSIWTGLAVIGQEIQWVDQWSSRGVGQGTRAHKTAGNRAYCARRVAWFSSGDQQERSNVFCPYREITGRRPQREKVVNSLVYRKDLFSSVFATFCWKFWR